MILNFKPLKNAFLKCASPPPPGTPAKFPLVLFVYPLLRRRGSIRNCPDLLPAVRL